MVVKSFGVVVTRSLPRDGGMAEDLRFLEGGQLPQSLARGYRERRNCQKASAAKSSLQNEMRGVLVE